MGRCGMRQLRVAATRCKRNFTVLRRAPRLPLWGQPCMGAVIASPRMTEAIAGRARYGASVAFRYGNDFGNNRYDQSTRCALESFVDSVAQAGGNSLRVWLFVEGRDLPADPPLACLSVPRANVGMHICMPRVVLHVVKCMPHCSLSCGQANPSRCSMRLGSSRPPMPPVHSSATCGRFSGFNPPLEYSTPDFRFPHCVR